MKKWWVKALLISILGVLLMCVISYIHTEVFLRGSMSEAQNARVSGRYAQFMLAAIFLIFVLADCFRRWNSRTEELSEKKLLQRASNAKRNVAALALLPTLFGLCLLWLTAKAPREANSEVVLYLVVLLVTAPALWILYAAVRRGEPGAIGTIIVFQLVILVLSALASAAFAVLVPPASPNPPGLAVAVFWGTIIHLGVYVSLMRSRSALIELRARGLSERVFPGAKSGKRLCTAGGALLGLGCAVFFAGVPFTGYLEGRSVAKQMRMAGSFVEIVENDEKEFMESFAELSTSDPEKAFDQAAKDLALIEQKIAIAWDEAADDEEMRAILATYGNGVKMWKSGFEEYRSPDGDKSEATRLVGEGDRLRKEAVTKFHEMCKRRAKG